MKETYRRQVELMLAVLPELSKETCFALHGGTAINLFHRDMPRLSVDIDLTYIPIEERAISMKRISEALSRIAHSLHNVIGQVRVHPRLDAGKLLVSVNGVGVKIEVNLVNRGLLGEPVVMPLCKKAQDAFEAFCAVPVVPTGQLYGGKIVAALDRQHPRDLFDVGALTLTEDLSGEVKAGFLLGLLGSERPLHEILRPKPKDQRSVLSNQFSG